MNNTTSFLPIELQNIIMSYTRPVYPYIRHLKIKINIFKLKNEEYKLKYEEESGLNFNNYYFCNLNKKYANEAIIEITHMAENYEDTEYLRV